MAHSHTIATATHAEFSGSRARRNWRSRIPARRVARQRTRTLWNRACTPRSNVSHARRNRGRQCARGCWRSRERNVTKRKTTSSVKTQAFGTLAEAPLLIALPFGNITFGGNQLGNVAFRQISVACSVSRMRFCLVFSTQIEMSILFKNN